MILILVALNLTITYRKKQVKRQIAIDVEIAKKSMAFARSVSDKGKNSIYKMLKKPFGEPSYPFLEYNQWAIAEHHFGRLGLGR